MKKVNKIYATNRKATHSYTLETKYEAGMSLQGWEVVAIRQAQINLANSYVSIKKGEAYLVGAHITPLETATSEKTDPLRNRKLLLNKRELNKLSGAIAQKGMSIVALKVYTKSGKMKLEIALAKGKKTHDKREAIKDRDIMREQQKSLKDIKRL